MLRQLVLAGVGCRGFRNVCLRHYHLTAWAAIIACAPSLAHAKTWPDSVVATNFSNGTWIPYLPTGGTRENRETYAGASSTLEVIQTIANIPQHDVDLGRTRLILRAKGGKRILLDETLNEVWECLGHNPRTGQFLLISKNEHGVKVTLRGLVYINETKASFKDSVFGKVQFHAVASLYNAESGYLALIGWRDIDASEGVIHVKLYVLDTNADELRELGRAPKPPPLEPEFRRTADDISMMYPWEGMERHYTDLEPFIWSFPEPKTLKVSFGNDTVKRRAKQRSEKRWDLEALFSRAK